MTPDIAQQHRILSEVAALADKGIIRTTLQEDYGTINAENLKRAHAAIESARGMGKIVLAAGERGSNEVYSKARRVDIKLLSPQS